MAFSMNSSSSRFSLGFSGDMNMEGDTKIMAFIQLTGIAVIFLFNLVLVRMKPRVTVASNRLATISGEAEVDLMHLTRYYLPHDAPLSHIPSPAAAKRLLDWNWV
ncbi:hypothetical protein GOBAR_AA25131 [Gossypium barbadense]|uniref:Uncharacterized protein n=1 Tax=Gossypium barbadense TaxID=3634 RepID=A0A2P5WWT2_GOSBA|nr:hypothetical protein GOBAR_AA25131 [Gossypium barbadense]